MHVHGNGEMLLTACSQLAGKYDEKIKHCIYRSQT